MDSQGGRKEKSEDPIDGKLVLLRTTMQKVRNWIAKNGGVSRFKRAAVEGSLEDDGGKARVIVSLHPTK